MKLAIFKHHTIVPRHTKVETPLSGECITRPMTEEEWEEYGPVNTTIKVKRKPVYDPKAKRRVKKMTAMKKYPHITNEFLERELQSKSYQKIADEQGIPVASLHYFAKRSGVASNGR